MVAPARQRATGTGHSPLADIHVKDIWAVIVRHWFLVALVTVVVAGGAWYTGRDAIAQYRSTLTLQVSASKTAFGRTDDIDVDPVALQTDPVLSEALVLSTQELARAVVRRLALQVAVDDPRIARGMVFANIAVDSGAALAAYAVVRNPDSEGWELLDASGSVQASGPYGARLQGPDFAFDVLPANGGPEEIEFRIVHEDQAAGWVRGGLSYQVRTATSAFDVSFIGTDPSLVPFVLNEAAVQLRNDGVERLRESIQRRASFIQDAIDSTELALRAVLDTIEEFKTTSQVTDLTAEESALVTTISQFDRDLITIRVRMSTLQSAIDEAAAGTLAALNRLAAVDAVQSNAALGFQVNRLLNLYEERRRLTAGNFGLRPDNPQVQTLDSEIADGHTALTDAAAASLISLQEQEEAVNQKITDLRSQLSRFVATENRMARIEISASTLRETARWLRAQHQLVQIQMASLGPYVSVLDGATPGVRIGTSLMQKVVLGVLVGILIGVGGAFFLEYLDQTIKTSSDVERVLRTPVLGRIPFESALSTDGQTNRIVTIDDLPSDNAASEAYRALRTNVTFVGAEQPLQFVVVSSPGPGEGKTTTAANLALTLASAGNKTLLIDGDLRRPQQHRAHRIVQEPGLTDVLADEAKLGEVIRTELSDNLDVIPAGRIPPNPSELLGSDVMRSVLDELRKDYEFILMDTPPILPVTDAVVAAATADATVVVLRSGSTEEGAATRAFEQLDRVKARVAGVVLNGVSARFDHHYAYYRYSGAYKERGPAGGSRRQKTTG